MIQLSFAGFLQIQYAVFWVMLLVMLVTAIIQVKYGVSSLHRVMVYNCRYLNQAMKAFDATVVVPTNFVFFTISAILAGDI